MFWHGANANLVNLIAKKSPSSPHLSSRIKSSERNKNDIKEVVEDTRLDVFRRDYKHFKGNAHLWFSSN